MDEFPITAAQVNITSPDTTTISNEDLARLTNTDKEKAASLLSTHGTPIEPDDLSVDDLGRVTVKNLKFAQEFTRNVQVADLNICPGDGSLIHIG
jgi:hypothetical protein